MPLNKETWSNLAMLYETPFKIFDKISFVWYNVITKAHLMGTELMILDNRSIWRTQNL